MSTRNLKWFLKFILILLEIHIFLKLCLFVPLIFHISVLVSHWKLQCNNLHIFNYSNDFKGADAGKMIKIDVVLQNLLIFVQVLEDY